MKLLLKSVFCVELHQIEHDFDNLYGSRKFGDFNVKDRDRSGRPQIFDYSTQTQRQLAEILHISLPGS